MKLRTFGGLAITDAVGASNTAGHLQRRQLALLAVLAAEGAIGVSRDRLLLLFWPDSNSDKARHALDQVLYIVRRELGPDAIVQGPTTLQLNSAVLPSDAAEFVTTLARGDLEAAVAAYAGPLLDGVHIPDALEFERWAEGRRDWFVQAFVGALRQLAAAASSRGDHTTAAHNLRRAVETEPLNGSLVHALMVALASGGSIAAALAVARTHEVLVRGELGAAPDPAVLDLVRALQADRGPQVSPVPRRAAAGFASMQDDATGTGSVADAPEVAPGIARRRSGYFGVATLAVATLAILGGLAGLSKGSPARHGAAFLQDRRQATTLGTITKPALSPDGAYLAYVTTHCGPPGCASDVDIQEVGSRVTRNIVKGVSLVDHIGWSPDQRNLIIAGTLVDGMEGLYLVSALGGTPHAIASYSSPAIFAGGDSMLLAPGAESDSVYWMRVAGLDGVPRDSFVVSGAGPGIPFVVNVPETSWFILTLNTDRGTEFRVIDRAGRETDRRSYRSVDISHASGDALWFSSDFKLMRLPFDTANGRFGTTLDTVYVGLLTGFDISADGRTLLLGEATENYEVWALSFEDVLHGVFPAERQLARGSSRFAITISPDGKRVLLARATGVAEAARFRLSTMPFDGGAERPVPTRGLPVGWTWIDSVSIVVDEVEAGRATAVLIDVRTGARLAAFTPPDSALACCPGTLPQGGWVWTPINQRSINVQRRDEATPRIFPAPPWFEGIWTFLASPDGEEILYVGKSATTDSLRVAVLSPRDSATTTWWTGAGIPNVDATWLTGGDVLLAVYPTPDTRTFYRMRRPGLMDSLGTTPRPIWGVDVSLDMKRAIVSTHEYHGDGWLYTVATR